MKNILILVIVTTAIYSCGDQKQNEGTTTDSFPGLREKAAGFFGTLPIVAENPENPITEDKVELGKNLYFDVRLSKDNTQSCNTCHNLDTYGVDNNAFSAGNDGDLGGRNSPTTLNAALHLSQFWDGREPDVEAQAGGPILNPVEMAMPSEESVVERLSEVPEYVDMFAKAFPDDPKPISYNNLKKAIGAFERKLITPSKFDKYLAGENSALNDQEKEGLQTFIATGCTTCHVGNLLGGNMYQKFGLLKNYWEFTNSEIIDNGRFDVTNNEFDKYLFKVPSLRNIEKTYPYFHDGSVKDLKKSIDIMAKIQLNKDLSDKELEDIAAFLGTLTGEVPPDMKM